MKIIFLDVDGVLINSACYREPLKVPGKRESAHPECMAHLNRIVEITGAVVVVSSVWRIGMSRVELQDLLRGWGFTGLVAGKTPRMFSRDGKSTLARGLEIENWMATGNVLHGSRPDSFCILDDDSDMEHLLPYLVQTRTAVGLTAEHVDAAVRLLMEVHQ